MAATGRESRYMVWVDAARQIDRVRISPAVGSVTDGGMLARSWPGIEASSFYCASAGELAQTSASQSRDRVCGWWVARAARSSR